MGRPKKNIQSPPPEQLVQELANIGATWQEIADVMGEPKTTLVDRFSEYYKKGASEISISVKREQHYVAMDRDHRSQATMLIWLGKQYCGQADKADVNTVATVDIKNDIKDKTPEQRREYVNTLQERVLAAN